jgi:hypothetical protein
MKAVKVTRVSEDGFWLLVGDEELMLAFAEFPWFKDATIKSIKQLSDVEWPSPDHLYWPLLDVDLSIESIRHPECFPLVSKGSPDTNGQRETPSQLGSPN